MKHRIILTLSALLCLATAFAGDFQVDNVTLKPGETTDLKVSLAATVTNVAGVQFDITMPDGFSLESINDQVYRLSTSQPADMTCNVSSLAGNTYRFVLYSSSLQKLKGSELIFLNLKASNTMSLAKYSLNFTGIAFSDIDGKVTKENGVVNATATVTNSFKLSYLVDGVEYKSYEIEFGKAITPEPAPTKEGHTFSGWSTIPETMPAHDVTITGTFSINKYKLTYKVDGVDYKTISYDYGSTITAEAAPTKEGYTFSGWSEIPTTMPAHDVIVEGSFSINKYKLIYQVDGMEYKSYEVEYGKTITPETAPTKEGYTFSGWSEIPVTMPAHDVTIKGTFKVIEYNVDNATYEVSDGEATFVGGENCSGDVEVPSTVVINNKTYPVTTISDGAFLNNPYITSVTIPQSVICIGANAFNGCSGLISIIIGEDVSVIGSKAFANLGSGAAARRANTRGTSGLIIKCYAVNVPTTAADAFENTSIGNASLFVDDNSVTAYKTTVPWNGFGTIMGFNEATDINGVWIDNGGRAKIFSIDGKPLNNLQKGINIIRMDNGKTKKVVVK